MHHNPRIVTDGLMLHLDAANPKSYPRSGTTWYDVSGNGRNATIKGSPLPGIDYDENWNGTFNFDNGSYASIPHDSEIESAVFGSSTNFTLCGWVYVQTLGNYGTLINKAQSGWYSGATNGLWIDIAGGIESVSATAESSNPSGSYLILRANSVVGYSNTDLTGRWMHIAYTGDGTTARLYIDAVQILSGAFSSITRTRNGTTNDIAIGTRDVNTSGTAVSSAVTDSIISTISAYGRGLSVTELEQNYNALRGRFGV
jgi:hypothetical protein